MLTRIGIFLFCLFSYSLSFGQAPDFTTLGNCPTGTVTVNIPAGVDTVILTNNNISTVLGTVAVDPDGGPITYSTMDSILTCNSGATFTIPVTATDDEGDTAICTVTVSISSTNPPIASCTDSVTIQLDATGMAMVSTNQVDNGSQVCSGTKDLYFGTTGTTSFNYNNIGDNTITLTVSDGTNTETCTSIVTVEDNIPPTANCQNFTLMLDNDGVDTIKIADINNGSTDNLGIDSMYISDSIFTCMNLGANTVTLTVLDESGNMSSCAAIVTVVDNIAPTANCFLADTVYLDANGSYTLSTMNVDSMSSDNCNNNLTLSIPPTTYSCTDVGNTYSVTLTASDGTNSNTCNTMVTVLDSIPPTSLNDISVVNTSGQCEATVTFSSTNPDNCGTVLITVNSASDPKMNPLTILTSGTDYFADFPVGESIVRYSMTDASSNTTVDSFTVTVLDNEAPEITCVGPQTINFAACEANNLLVPDLRGLAAISDNCGGGNTITQIPSQLDSLKDHITIVDGASFTIKVIATDNNANGLADTCDIVVNLNQDDTPITTFTGGILPSETSSCDSIILDAPTAMDACGNVICGQPFPAVATMNGTCPTALNTMPTFSSGVLNDDLSGIDNCPSTGASYTNVISVPATTNTIGDLDVNLNIEHTWVGDLSVTITSPSGTQATLFTRPGTGINDDANDFCNFWFNIGGFGLNDHNIFNTFDDEASNTAADFENASDIISFQDYQPIDLLSIFDGENPTGNWEIEIFDGGGGDTGNFISWDLEFLLTPPVSTTLPTYTFPPGNHTITWVFDDGNGNSTSQIQTINVTNDTQEPTITCANNISVQLDANGNATIFPSDIFVNATDVCGVDNSTLRFLTSSGSSNQIFYNCDSILNNNMVTLAIDDINGNTATCTIPITVEDNTPPVFDATTTPADTIVLAGCDNIPPVAVGIIANDNCGTVGMNFNESSTQNGNSSLCADYLYIITRTWTATDASGNSSTHTQTITVFDNGKPTFNLPSQLFFNANQGSCEASVLLSITGSQLSDNCAPFNDLTITNDAPVGNGTTDASGVYPVGSTLVTFEATDPCGNPSMHTVMVNVTDNTPPIASCKNNVAATIPAGASQITIPYQLIDNGSFDNCAGLTYSVSPSSFDCSQADGVTAWPITLTVTENVPGGQSSSCQTSIIIQDNTNPVAMCKDITVNLDANGNASITAADIDNGSFDACSGIESIVLLTQSNFTEAFVGLNFASIEVTDMNGNRDTCNSIVTVAPPETCFSVDDGIGGNGFLAGTGISEVPVNTTNFVNAQGFQFTLEIDETVATFVGINNIDPALSSGGLLTVIPNAAGDTLTVSWLNTSGTPLTLNTAQLFTITVDVVGVVGAMTPITFINLPTPPEFTSQYGTTIFTNPNFPPCTENGLIEVDVTATLTVAGNIRTWGVTNIDTLIDNTMTPPDTTISTTVVFPVQDVANVVISKTETHPGLNGGAPLSATNAATTDAAGDYLAVVSNQPGGVDLDLNASKGTPNWLNNGDVSSSDLFFIQQHIVANIPFISIFQYVASDVNGDGLVTTLDLVLIQDVIVNPEGSPAPSSVITAYAPWRFVPATDSLHLQPLPALPNAPIINEQISFTGYTTAVNDADWIAVKIGQVSGSLNTSLLTVAETRSGEHLDLHVENQKVTSGDLISIPVYAKDFADYIAWQFTLEFDVNTLEYEGLIPGAVSNFKENKLGLNAVDQGIIGALWYGNALEVNEDEALFTLQFRAIEDADALSGLLDINSKTVNAETSLINGAKGNVNLSFFEPTTTVSSEFELHQNRPNPFNGKTVISFVLPEAGFGTLTVYDISGRVLKEVEGDFAKGYNEVNIHSKDISTSGVLYYQLESAEYTATKKMIILD